MEWGGKRVLITGGAGFVGSHLVDEILRCGARVRVADNFTRGAPENLAHVMGDIELIERDLLNPEQALQACKHQDVVFNLVSKVAGAAYSGTNHADLLTVNFQLASVVTQAARRAGVERFLAVSSACVYAEDTTVPTSEEEGFRGDPESVNLGYGWAKRMSEKLAQLHARESSMQVGIVRPFNAYGPRDRFDKQASHVIPSLIRRIEGGEDPLTVWGSGHQTRTFLYATDLAKAMRLVVENGMSAQPINVASEEEVSIRDLVSAVATACDARPAIVYDESRPEGHKRRAAKLERLRALTGWVPDTPLVSGLQQTVEDFRRRAAQDRF